MIFNVLFSDLVNLCWMIIMRGNPEKTDLPRLWTLSYSPISQWNCKKNVKILLRTEQQFANFVRIIWRMRKMLQQRTDQKKYLYLILTLSSLPVILGEEDDSSNNIFGGSGQRSCQADSECSLTLACITSVCLDPCHAATATPCPMKGGVCKVRQSVVI